MLIGEGHPSNQTPLYLAAAWGHADVCEILIEAGAKTNVCHARSKRSALEIVQIRGWIIPDNEEYPDSIRGDATPKEIEAYKRIALLLQTK